MIDRTLEPHQLEQEIQERDRNRVIDGKIYSCPVQGDQRIVFPFSFPWQKPRAIKDPISVRYAQQRRGQD
jgi:hypothetical protein